MKQEYNLVNIVEMWLSGIIGDEQMKQMYAKIPKFTPRVWDYETDIDPIMFSEGTGNTHLEVKADLVGSGKMTLQQFFHWRDIVKDVDSRS